ncbi:MAG: response regulator [Thermodesulfobacteriota bacterium]|nr:response regulator [Deltaproteobacteria bacterium]
MKIFTVSQASKYCKVAPKTIINWIEAGHINAYRTVGGHRRIKKEDLDRFLEEHQMPAFEESSEDTRKKILVVDDDQIIVETIVQSLEEDEHGYELISAADGFEAGIQVSHFKPDLIILDIMMPDINGYEVCKKIKSKPETKHIKIIVLSAYLDDENYKQMEEYGADACFSKPLPLPELKQQVAKLLGIKGTK